MALTVRQQAFYWGAAGAAFLAALWLVGDVILPFVVGGAVAYFLDPVADRLERLGCGRAVATALITLGAVLVFAVMALAVVPILIEQAAALAGAVPQIMRQLQDVLTERFPELMEEDSVLRRSLAGLGERLSANGAAVVEGVVASALSLFNVLVLAFIVPVVAFYLLLDWDRIVARVDELLPREHAPTIRRLAREIDDTLAAFIRGQGTVMLIQGAFYACALMVVGLQFGLVVGAVAGLLSFIPYVGAIVGGGLSIGLALFQYWSSVEVATADGIAYQTDWIRIAVVAAIFFAGQVIEGNFLTPKLVGSSVGLHPVWLLFSLAVFGALFGFVGLLVAVPVMAAFGVLARYAVDRYKGGLLYRGAAPPGAGGDGGGE